MPFSLFKRFVKLPLLLTLLFCTLSSACNGQTPYVVCDKGFGSFKSTFTSGVTVSVGAAKSNGFAERTCQATLTWNKGALVVEPTASQVDVDVMGADLGLGSPVVAFQIRKDAADPRIAYEIYSLAKPPRLLRTVTGEAFFSAADTLLNGRVELWTIDAGAVNGFEGLPIDALDLPPSIVLRFEKKRLVDVSSEFSSHFDEQIAGLRNQLTAKQLSDFKNSDGKISSATPRSPDQLHQLLTTKIKVLEIVWSYLYSGRNQDAEKALADMWPPADLARIRASILSAQSRGIRTEVDAVSHQRPATIHRRQEYIYEYLKHNGGGTTPGAPDQDPNHTMASALGLGAHVAAEKRALEIDSFPTPILLRRRPSPQGSQLPLGSEYVYLVVDEAGKVRSATMTGSPDKELLQAAKDWKFIPAFKDGVPVASRMEFDINNYR